MFGGSPGATAEAAARATPTTAVPSDQDAGSGTGGSTSAPTQLQLEGNLGAPVDLWDTDWPNGGYYWTVVPVEADSPGSLTASVSVPGSVANVTTLPVAGAYQFAPGDVVLIGTTGNQETETVTAATVTTLTFATTLK